jgi:hypothetical protein
VDTILLASAHWTSSATLTFSFATQTNQPPIMDSIALQTPTDENRLGDAIEDTPELLNVMGDPRAWVENSGIDVTESHMEDVFDDYERLLRIIQLLLATGRLDREDVAEVADAEERLF